MHHTTDATLTAPTTRPPTHPPTHLPCRSLEWVIGEHASHSPASALIGRRLQSRLPSFTENFTQSVPLTRIRDIAHRQAAAHAAGEGGRAA
jgi:hypothetical protein